MKIESVILMLRAVCVCVLVAYAQPNRPPSCGTQIDVSCMWPHTVGKCHLGLPFSQLFPVLIEFLFNLVNYKAHDYITKLL